MKYSCPDVARWWLSTFLAVGYAGWGFEFWATPFKDNKYSMCWCFISHVAGFFRMDLKLNLATAVTYTVCVQGSGKPPTFANWLVGAVNLDVYVFLILALKNLWKQLLLCVEMLTFSRPVLYLLLWLLYSADCPKFLNYLYFELIR